jgi:GntR family transcriptional regulator/MocR family aminotransferase
VSAQIPFDRSSSVPYQRQVYEGYLTAIRDGRLRPGDRLPASRELAEALGISRTPVLDAFERLRFEGFVAGRAGSGTFVAPHAAALAGGPSAPAQAARRSGATRTPARLPADPWLPADTYEPRPRFRPFHRSIPAVDLFPYQVWGRLARRHLRWTADELLASGDPLGVPALREQAAEQLRTTRMVRCEPEQVFVVSGSIMALQMAAVALVAEREAVGAEACTRLGARQAVGVLRVPVLPVAGEAPDRDDHALSDGLDERIRFVYVTPSHRYLFGPPMGPERRRRLLDWAEEHDGWIFEEDYDSDLRFDGYRPVPLHGERPSDRVIYLRTFVRTMFPNLKTAFLVVPHDLVPLFRRVRRALAHGTSALHQAAFADFIAEGHYDRHLRRTRRAYQDRRAATADALRRHGGDVLDVHVAEAGIELAVTFPSSLPDRVAAKAAARAGVSSVALSYFYPERNGLILGYGCSTPDELTAAARTLVDVLRTGSTPDGRPGLTA